MTTLAALLRCLACALMMLPAAASAATAAGAGPADPGFSNPLVRQRADPHAIRHTDGYYLSLMHI